MTTKNKKFPYPLLCIEWEDSYAGDSTWVDLSMREGMYPLRIVSVGFLVEEDGDRICLYQNLQIENNINDTRGSNHIVIPKSLIKTRKILLK